MIVATIAMEAPNSRKAIIELVGGARKVSGIHSEATTGQTQADDKSAGDLIGAVVEIATEKAIGPLVDLLRGLLIRDRKLKLSFKVDKFEFELDGTNIDTDLKEVEAVLKRLAKAHVG